MLFFPRSWPSQASLLPIAGGGEGLRPDPSGGPFPLRVNLSTARARNCDRDHRVLSNLFSWRSSKDVIGQVSAHPQEPCMLSFGDGDGSLKSDLSCRGEQEKRKKQNWVTWRLQGRAVFAACTCLFVSSLISGHFCAKPTVAVLSWNSGPAFLSPGRSRAPWATFPAPSRVLL